MGNSLAPGYIRFFYTANGHSHRQVVPVKPSGSCAADSTLLSKKGGGTVNWRSAMDAWKVLWKAIFKTTATLETAELWFQADADSVPLLCDTYNIGQAGTSSGAEQAWMQMRYSFRGGQGFRSVLQFMEPVATVPNTKVFPPTYGSITGVQAIADFVINNDSWFFTRGGDFVSSPILMVSKINDKLRKKYLLP